MCAEQRRLEQLSFGTAFTTDALCREIAEAHGGGISIADRPERGAVVRVRLPGRVRDDAGNLTRSRLTLSANSSSAWRTAAPRGTGSARTAVPILL